jgi:hypothetical protein
MLQMLFRVALQQQVNSGLSEQLSKRRLRDDAWTGKQFYWQVRACFVILPSQITGQCLGHSSHK